MFCEFCERAVCTACLGHGKTGSQPCVRCGGDGHEPELITDECSGCGDVVTEGTPHDCPVLGTQVTVERA